MFWESTCLFIVGKSFQELWEVRLRKLTLIFLSLISLKYYILKYFFLNDEKIDENLINKKIY